MALCGVLNESGRFLPAIFLLVRQFPTTGMVRRRLNELKPAKYSSSHRISTCFATELLTKDAAMKALNSINPFVLMLDPEAVIHAMECSSSLRGLRNRVCRPLDKPLIPKTHGTARDYDALIDAEEFMDSGSECYVEAQPALRLAVH